MNTELYFAIIAFVSKDYHLHLQQVHVLAHDFLRRLQLSDMVSVILDLPVDPLAGVFLEL